MRVLATIGLLCAMVATAHARPDRGPDDINKPWQRLLGFGIGLGAIGSDDAISCPGCGRHNPALNLEFQLGALPTDRWAMVLDGALRIGNKDQVDNNVFEATAMAGVRHWIVKRLWVEGGAGVIAHVRYGIDIDTVSHTGYTAHAIVGLETVSERDFALDVRIRASGATYRTDSERGYSGSLIVGLNTAIY